MLKNSKKIMILLFLLTFSAFGQVTTVAEDFSDSQIEQMGGNYISELYLFLDDVYCDIDEVRFPVTREYCVRAYLKELLLIKKRTWAQYFHKEASGLYSKLDIMEEGSPISCEVTLEVPDLERHYFNIYCDH